MITPSEDKVYMTEDLADRLSEDDLAKPNVVHDEGPEPEDIYETNSFVFPVPTPPLPDPIKAVLMVTFADSPGEPLVLDSTLQALSFGQEGWLCTVSTDDKPVVALALKAAKESITSVRVVLPDGAIELHTKVDCTASFSYGSASLTVTADEASYV